MQPTTTQLRRRHRALTAVHTKACKVAEEAERACDADEAAILMDPTIELHSALCCIEGFMEERGLTL